MARNGDTSDIPVYAPAARRYHWLVAFLILIQFPIAFYMTYRGYQMPAGVDDAGAAKFGVWDEVTNTLYSSHKLIGIIIFSVVLLRLAYRLMNGAPRPDPSVPSAMIGISHGVHWSIYLLLLAVPIGGYIGTSYYGALNVFGIPFPAVTEKDQKFSETVMEYHELAAIILLSLVALHIAASIYHRFVRKDRVVERMLPKRTV